MPDSEAREGRWRPFSHWGSLSAELVLYNIHVGTNIAEYWRRLAEIQRRCRYGNCRPARDTVRSAAEVHGN